jgi:hypothetical protein
MACENSALTVRLKPGVRATVIGYSLIFIRNPACWIQGLASAHVGAEQKDRQAFHGWRLRMRSQAVGLRKYISEAWRMTEK